MNVFPQKYLITNNRVILPLLNACLTCQGRTLQLYKYRTSQTGEGNKQNVRVCATEDIYKKTECVLERIYDTKVDVYKWLGCVVWVG